MKNRNPRHQTIPCKISLKLKSCFPNSRNINSTYITQKPRNNTKTQCNGGIPIAWGLGSMIWDFKVRSDFSFNRLFDYHNSSSLGTLFSLSFVLFVCFVVPVFVFQGRLIKS